MRRKLIEQAPRQPTEPPTSSWEVIGYGSKLWVVSVPRRPGQLVLYQTDFGYAPPERRIREAAVSNGIGGVRAVYASIGMVSAEEVVATTLDPTLKVPLLR